jgi:hypothetical protein
MKKREQDTPSIIERKKKRKEAYHFETDPLFIQ